MTQVWKRGVALLIAAMLCLAAASAISLASTEKAHAAITFKLSKVATDKDYYVYTGKTIKPKLTVNWTAGWFASGGFATSKEYSKTYYLKTNGKWKKVSSVKKAGDYKVVVKGKKSCKGSVSTTFKVVKGKLITKVKLSKQEQYFTGENLTPSVTVYSGKKKLSSKYYTVAVYKSKLDSFSEKQLSKMVYYTPAQLNSKTWAKTKSAKEEGAYKVVITGKNGYKGSATAYFCIYPQKPYVHYINSDYEFSMVAKYIPNCTDLTYYVAASPDGYWGNYLKEDIPGKEYTALQKVNRADLEPASNHYVGLIYRVGFSYLDRAGEPQGWGYYYESTPMPFKL